MDSRSETRSPRGVRWAFVTEEAGTPPTRKTLFDTSVLVAALVERLPEHPRAAAELRRVSATKRDACAAVHALAELYAVLTTLPVSPRITPGQARRLVQHNVSSRMELVALDGFDYDATVDRLTDLGLSGGVVYDALHLRAAEKAGAERLVTFNRRDFERFSAATRVEVAVL